MKLYSILFLVVCLVGIYIPCQAFPEAMPLQDLVDKLVDVQKFQQQGFESINKTTLQQIWSFFKTKFRRHYFTDEEDEQRHQIFRNHLKIVLMVNLLRKASFKLALNEFADLSDDEFLAKKTGLVPPTQNSPSDASQSNDDDDDNEERALERSLSKLAQERYHSRRRLKRNSYGKRNHHYYNRRSFIDWIKHFFGDDDDDDQNNNGTVSTDSFDWRTKNIVTSVKNQGDCGSCYAFATTAVMESLYAIKTQAQTLIDFSPQQIVDCSTESPNNGCNGGNFQPSLNYIKSQSGNIATLASYPYAGTKQQCKTDGFDRIPLGNLKYNSVKKNENALAKALTTHGPIFVGIHVDSTLSRFYTSGIYKLDNCPNSMSDMNHAVTLVGYGYDNDTKAAYWIIKNSWGTTWGEQGYFRLAKDAGNMCGIATMAQYATFT